MKPKCRFNTCCLLKVAICLGLWGFLAGECHAQVGTPPVIAVQPLGATVSNGGMASFNVTAVSLTAMQFTWYCNSQKLSDSNVANVVVPLVGTISTLTLSNVTPAYAGNYWVKVQNAVGEVTSSYVALSVQPSRGSNALQVVLNGVGMMANGFKLQMTGPPGSNYIVEASTDLKNWVPIATNAAPAGSASCLDPQATNFACRYYRARLQ